MTDDRLRSLRRWLSDELGFGGCELTPASGDASFRRYFRLTRGTQSWIVMDAPPDREPVAPFLHVAGLLEAGRLNVPRIIAQDTARGFLLLSDLGHRTYLDALADGADADVLYGQAFEALVRMQSIDAGAASLPPYDEDLLKRELNLFRDWLCGRHLGLALTPLEAKRLDASFDYLIEAALAQPRVFVHRDYHSRNLMLTEGRQPGILDFQDAVCGPVAYDLVSLLRDCYIAWPPARVREWAIEYREQAARRRLPIGRDAAEYLQWFDLMGVQRHLKAAGIFARLHHRDGKPDYLADIPRTLGYILEVAPNHPPLEFLSELVATRVLPRLEPGPAERPACGR
ncbi:phosphotransferase [soil metagenome]